MVISDLRSLGMMVARGNWRRSCPSLRLVTLKELVLISVKYTLGELVWQGVGWCACVCVCMYVYVIP